MAAIVPLPLPRGKREGPSHHFYVESTGKPIGVNLIGNWPALDVSKQKSTFLEREADWRSDDERRIEPTSVTCVFPSSVVNSSFRVHRLGVSQRRDIALALQPDPHFCGTPNSFVDC